MHDVKVHAVLTRRFIEGADNLGLTRREGAAYIYLQYIHVCCNRVHSVLLRSELHAKW